MVSERNVKPNESVAVGERERLIAELDEWCNDGEPPSEMESLFRRCRAALEASHAPVPREPTIDMIEAAINNDLAPISMDLAAEVWRAMYDAAAGTTPEPVKP